MIYKPPFKDKSTTRRAQRSESQGAKNENGRRVSGSGNRREKGDYRTAKFRTEDKVSDAASFTLKLSTLKKIEHEALRTPPVLMPKMRVTMQGHTYWIMREVDCLALGIGEAG